MVTNNNQPILRLSDLIREHQDKTGDSYGDIARKTGLSKAKIGQLALPKNTYLVRQETLAKLAQGLAIPLATVERASLGTAGFKTPDIQQSDRIRGIVDKLEELPASSLELVAELVDVIAKRSPRRRPRK